MLLDILLLIVVLGPPEQKDVRFRRYRLSQYCLWVILPQDNRHTMNLVMDPAQALLDADAPPFVIREEAEGARVIVIEVTLRNEFEERLWEDYMSVLELVV